MTNLFYVSLAYKMAMLQLVLPEVNYVSHQLNLPTPHPIEMTDVTEALVSPPKFGPAIRIETTNFVFTFPRGKLYAVINKTKHLERFDLYPVWAQTPSLIDSNGAVRLAKQWLGDIDVDVDRLEKKYGSTPEVRQSFFWNKPGHGWMNMEHSPGDTNKTMLPIFTVRWGSGPDYAADVEILGTTKELMSLYLSYSDSLSRRPSVVPTNAVELNNIPDPPAEHLQRPPSAVPSTVR